LRGWKPEIAPRHRNRAEYGLGIIGGLYGGISGIWGPPVIVYLLALRTEKTEMVRVMGVVFLIGAVVLTLAHLGSGVLNATTLPFSAVLVIPAALGMWLGFRQQDKLDAERFRWWTLVVLMVIALNLIRRAIFG
ncbi:MAG TPA: TSUP family transporter, partial [Paracoccus sp.]|nr:TSUP family transporter [Paracoccus sp. (in: a-proteobacteria)]